MKNYRLEIAVFLCGAAVMILEMAGSRVLAPYLGTSIVVWTSLIGVILGALSLGYHLGGKTADKNPEAGRLGRIILAAALCTAAIAGVKSFLLTFLQRTDSLHLAASAATVALFAPPAVLLGMVSPFAARLAITDAASSGAAVGRLYALSTLGSILGTFAAGFVLLGFLGTTNVILATAALTTAASLCVSGRDAALKLAALGLIAAALIASAVQDANLRAAGLYDADTAYQRILVYNSRDSLSPRDIRVMSTGPHGKQSAMFLDDTTDLVLPYTRRFRLAEHFAPRLTRLLVLGGGAYSFPKYALAHYPGCRIDAVEIDPGVTELAREHFALTDDPRLSIIHQDARTFLNRAQGPYDAVICDTFNSHYSVPFHLTTVETARRIRDALAPDGVALINLISSVRGEQSQLFRALVATYREAFPEVRAYGVWGVDGEFAQNIILAAFKTPPASEKSPPDPDLAAMLAMRVTANPEPGPPPLTDDYAPVERYTLPLAMR